jgi:hypothetical protein
VPVWVSIYFSGYLAFSLWTHSSDFREGKIDTWAIFEAIGNICLLVPALAFWFPSLQLLLGKSVSLFFVIGVLAVAVFSYRGFRKNYPDPNLSMSENIGLSVFSTIFFILITSPLIWWGSQILVNRPI